MQLNDFIKKYGAKKLAEKLNVTSEVIYQWSRGQTFPRPEKLHHLNEVSKGKVSYKTMVNHYLQTKYNHR